MEQIENNDITFIIPTIGRNSLKNSIDCLLKQSINNWKAIIIFDGIKKNIDITDPRITILEIEKCGIEMNSAGLVRNRGIEIATTKWIALLDDDDEITCDYIQCFNEEIKFYDPDLIIFRMQFADGLYLPKQNSPDFYICAVGISFAFKKKIFETVKFIPSATEDFYFLDNVRKNKFKIIISEYITYFVRTKALKLDRIHKQAVLLNY